MVVKAGEVDQDTSDERDALSRFRAALGQGQIKSINVFSHENGKRAFVCKVEVISDDFDAVISQVQVDYPQGGDYLFQIINKDGRFADTVPMSIAPLPKRLQVIEPQPSAARPSNQLDPMMQMLMAEREQAKETNKLLLSGILGVATAAIPHLFKGRSGESPVEMIAALMDIQKNLTPAPVEAKNNFLETIETMKAIKELMPDGGGEDNGLGGMAKGLLPVLLTMMQNQPQAQATTTAQVQQPRIAAPAAQPAQTAAQTPASMQDSAPTEPADPIEAALLAKYGPFMAGIKRIVEKGKDANVVASYVNLQEATEEISTADLDMLLQFMENQENDEKLVEILGKFGIGAEHANVIRDAIALLSGGVDDEPEGDGLDGNATGVAGNGASGGGGVGQAGGAINGAVAH